jgi:hypothetical protein
MGKRLIACPVCLGYGWLPLKRPGPTGGAGTSAPAVAGGDCL